MQSYRHFFCSRSGTVVCGNFYADSFAFGFVTSNLGIVGVDIENIPFQLFQQVDGSNNFVKVSRQFYAIIFSGTECDWVLYFTSPYDQATGINYHVSRL